VTTSGDAERDGFVRINEELLAHPRFRPGLTLLVDHTDLSLAPLSHADLDWAFTSRQQALAWLQSPQP